MAGATDEEPDNAAMTRSGIMCNCRRGTRVVQMLENSGRSAP